MEIIIVKPTATEIEILELIEQLKFEEMFLSRHGRKITVLKTPTDITATDNHSQRIIKEIEPLPY